MGTQALKSAASAISPRPRDEYNTTIIKHGANIYASSAKGMASIRPGSFFEFVFFFGDCLMMLIAEPCSMENLRLPAIRSDKFGNDRSIHAAELF